MTWEQLVVPVLVVLALLVQLMRMLKGTVEETQGEEVEATSIPVAMKRRVPVRKSRGLRETPRTERPAMEAFPAARRRQLLIAATAPDMRRGIILMTVLGPCRGLEPSPVSRALDRG
ncbi:MAG TPA: hypothetical protein VFR79_12860 [Nitrospira sp.]|nr:hypothetical protein [Nitrospira sp.]